MKAPAIKQAAILLLALTVVGLTWVGLRRAGSNEYSGTLRARVLGIGGETTGTILVTPAGAYELDLSGLVNGRSAADELDGARVIVRGRLRVVHGIEVKNRRIIAVESIQRAAP